MNDTLASLVLGLSVLVEVVCFILVLIQMFRRGATGLGIVCIVLSPCCTLGGLIAFIYGWVKAREWNLVNLMTIWTVAFAIQVLTGVVNPAPLQLLREMLKI